MIAQPTRMYGFRGQWFFPVTLAWLVLLVPPLYLHAAPVPIPSLPDLIRALEDKDDTVRANAALALKERGREAVPAVPALLRVLEDPQPKVRNAAARALYAIQGKKALSVIVKALKAETDPDVRFLLVTIVMQWCRDRGPEVEEIIPVLIETVKMDHEKYEKAIESSWTSFIIIGPKGISTLVGLAKDKDLDPLTRASAVYHLGHMGFSGLMPAAEAKKITSPLVDLLQEPDDNLASRTADALRLIGAKGKGVVKALEAMGEQDSMRRCVAAADALAKIDPNNKHLVPLVLKILKHGDRSARARGVDVAGQLGPRAQEAVPALLRELNDAYEYNRRDAVRALGVVAPTDKTVLIALQKACRDPSPVVRKTAIELIEKIKPKGRPL